jgi:endonuclease/exonuclease/phosphatase family metal-dependent hydrolase
MHSGDGWSRHVSEPSGPGNEEVHEVFVRHPIRVVDTRTTMTSSSGGSFSHAPFSVLLEDTRFAEECDQRFVVTSVHFPPKGKREERDNQIRSFFEDYASLSINRLLTPLTAKGARDAGTAPVNHLIAGDFNCAVTDEIVDLGKHSFQKPLLDARIATSAGKEAYDNFLLSKDAVFAIEARPLELAVCSQRGLSDHHPIALKLTEVSKVKKK